MRPQVLRNLIDAFEPMPGLLLCEQVKDDMTAENIFMPTETKDAKARAHIFRVLKVPSDVKDIEPGDMLLAAASIISPFSHVKRYVFTVKRDHILARVPRDSATAQAAFEDHQKLASNGERPTLP